MPYRVQKPYVIMNGQRLYSPTAVPQSMAVCDRCNELVATTASLYSELPMNKWKFWQWFSYPKFACQEEAFMGCEKHPVAPEIQFLNGETERFIRLPLTRWQRMKEPDTLIVATALALVFGVIFGVIFALVFK